MSQTRALNLLSAAVNGAWTEVHFLLNKYPDTPIFFFSAGIHKGKTVLWLAAEAQQWHIVEIIVRANIGDPAHLTELLNKQPTPEIAYTPAKDCNFKVMQAYSHSVFSARYKTVLWFVLYYQKWELALLLDSHGALLGDKRQLDEDIVFHYQCLTKPLMSLEACRGLAAILPKFKPIATLSLLGSILTNFRIKVVLDALYCHPIQVLNCSHCCLSNDGAKEVAKFIAKNKTLKKIYLNDNRIMDIGVETLCEVLKKNESIEFISLSTNRFSSYGVKCIAEMLRVNKSIKEIELHLNEAGEVGGALLAAAMQDNHVIQSCQVSISQVGLQNFTQIYNSAARNRKEAANLSIDMACKRIS